MGLSGGLDIESRLHEILPPSEEMYCQVLSNLEVGDNFSSLEFEEQGSKLAELFAPLYFIRFRVRGLGFTPQKTLKNFLKIPQKFIE